MGWVMSSLEEEHEHLEWSLAIVTLESVIESSGAELSRDEGRYNLYF